MTSPVSLLLIARPGRMRDGLQALLRTIPGIEIIGQADCGTRALTLISEKELPLVLLDSSPGSAEMLATLRQIKDGHPQVRCIALVENAQQQVAAKEAGADTALVTGFSAEVLHAAVDGALMAIRRNRSGTPN